MKKMLLISLGLLCIAGAAFAGNNAGASAYLSWNPLSQVTDTAASAANQLYVRYVAAAGHNLDFKGSEIDLIWDPPGDGAGCFDHTGTTYKTSLTTTCTYLNRGSAVPVVTADDPNHFHVAWADAVSQGFTSCSAGAGIQIAFETDTCANPAGCLTLTSCTLLDTNNAVDPCQIANPSVTVAGGTSHCPASAVEPSTWGHIKGLYRP